jgi:co-chaperonin GroES (HSP10)
MAELTREQFGNSSTEEGAAVEGSDFGALNHSVLPEGRAQAVEVDAEYVAGDGLRLTPKQDGLVGYSDFVLREGPNDQLTHALCEEETHPESMGMAVWRNPAGDIEVQANPRRLGEITVRSPREELVWYGMHPEYYGAASGDRICLRRDVMESQYVCKACSGEGFLENASMCLTCSGSARETVRAQQGWVTVPCRSCQVLGYEKQKPYSCGLERCEKCSGSGWKGGIVIPEQSQSSAVTGVVVSVGPMVTHWKIGDRLVFSRFAGHTLDVSKTESFIWMHEKEPIGILRQRTDRP